MGQREDNVGTLEDAAAKRRARLLDLKNKKKKNQSDSVDGNEPEEDESLPTPQVLFRNYKPSSEALADGVVEPAEPSDVEAMVEGQLTDARQVASEMQQVELSSLAPKKITFDLKRGIQTTLDKLDRATDRAIAELIRERLKDSSDQSDLLAAVNAGAMAGRHTEEELD